MNKQVPENKKGPICIKSSVKNYQLRTINYNSHPLSIGRKYNQLSCPSRTRKWYKLVRKKKAETKKAMKAKKRKNTKARMDTKR